MSGYIGTDNLARRITNIYVGKDGIARKVKKIYVGEDIGDNTNIDKARLIYQSGKTMYYSFDQENWEQYTGSEDKLFTIPDTIYIKYE